MAKRVLLQRDGVLAVDSCALTVGTERWPFADAHRGPIGEHWRRRSAENPKFFNGQIYVLIEGGLDGGVFRGALAPADFASYLYWRDNGFGDSTVRDCFGTAVIRSADGAVMLARQKAGQINSGLLYLPGGFLDARDAGADRLVAVTGAISREVAEETGLGPPDLEPQPGLLISCAGPLVSVAQVYRSRLTAAELEKTVDAHIRADPAAELEGIAFASSYDALDAGAVPLYARQLLQRVLSAE